MSIASDARSYTDIALDQGKTTLTAIPERVVSLAGAATARASAVAGDSRGLARGAYAVARKQAYTNLGLSDVVLATITKRSAELPGDLRQNAVELVESARDRLRQANGLAARAQHRFASAAGDLNQRRSELLNAASGMHLADVTAGAYDKLAARGEQVATDLRHDPVLVRVITDVDTRVEQAANELTSVAQKVRARAAAQAQQESAAATPTPVRPTPARMIPSHKTTVRKTPAGEASISTTPIHRAAAYESETRRAAASKAAATRKENAEAEEQAAQARSAAATQAAATRAENAERAAAKRKATARKAAATRKANAATTAAGN